MDEVFAKVTNQDQPLLQGHQWQAFTNQHTPCEQGYVCSVEVEVG